MPDRVLISWDGQEPQACLLRLDEPAGFELVLFDYSGRASRPDALPAGWPPRWRWLSRATACKGEILDVLAVELSAWDGGGGWIGLLDDDIAIAVSQINQTLARAAELGSLCCSPVLPADEPACVPHMRKQGAGPWRSVPWVELKMPFVRADLFQAAAPFYPLSISSYGIDCFVYPYWARVLDLPGGLQVFDDLVVRDCRPHRSGGLIFANGLTGLQEAQRLHRLCLRHLALRRPDLIADPCVRVVLRLPQGPWVA